MSSPTEVLAGLVERVTFHNGENGFCVLRVKARGRSILPGLVRQRIVPEIPLHSAVKARRAEPV
jgi:hypothetical protein